MSRFDTCLEFVLGKEGGKVDDPTDRGGRTNKGITQSTYDSFRKSKGLASKDVWEIDDSEVKEIYFSSYWNPIKCGQLPAPLDLAVFDAGVNCGTRRSAKWLQSALGLPFADIDGVIGIKTLTYVSDAKIANEIDRVFARFQDLRNTHYKDLVLRDPSQAKFIKGWQNRIVAVNEAAKDTGNVA